MKGTIKVVRTPAEQRIIAMLKETTSFDKEHQVFYCNLDPHRGKRWDIFTRWLIDSIGFEKTWEYLKRYHLMKYHEFQLSVIEAANREEANKAIADEK